MEIKLKKYIFARESSSMVTFICCISEITGRRRHPPPGSLFLGYPPTLWLSWRPLVTIPQLVDVVGECIISQPTQISPLRVFFQLSKGGKTQLLFFGQSYRRWSLRVSSHRISSIFYPCQRDETSLKD